MKTSILYEDNYLLIAYKPAGLATQTGKVGQMDMVSELKGYTKSSYLGVIHRLDQPVEGLLVFGKTKEVSAALTAQLTQEGLHKQYYAVICGQPKQKEAELVDYMYKTKENRAEIVSGEDAVRFQAKKAVLRYQILQEQELVSGGVVSKLYLADIMLQTGRFHQIRAQMAHAGFPLVGDQKYGSEKSVSIGKEQKVRNVALCAYRIHLTHPVTKEKIDISVTPKGDIFQKFVF